MQMRYQVFIAVLESLFAFVTLSAAKGLDSSVATLRMTDIRNYFWKLL